MRKYGSAPPHPNSAALLSLVSVTHSQLKSKNTEWKIPEIIHKRCSE